MEIAFSNFYHIFLLFLCAVYTKFESTAVDQVVACAPVAQRARVRSPVGTSFLGEVFRGFPSPVRQMSGSFRPQRSPNNIWPSLSSILIHYGRQWPEMLTRPQTSNTHIQALHLRHQPSRPCKKQMAIVNNTMNYRNHRCVLFTAIINNDKVMA